jgi:hypothetical protein
MGDELQRGNWLTAVRKACRIGKALRQIGVRPYGIVRIDSAAGVADWDKDPKANTKRIAQTFREGADIAEAHGERLAAEGEICWGGMHSWRNMVNLLEATDRPQTVGFQADMAHTLLYTLGYNAEKDAILPAGYDWKNKKTLDKALEKLTVDHRFPRGPKRRDRQRLRRPRQNRPSLCRERSQGQARHPAPRRLLDAGRQTKAHQILHAHLLGRLHVPQRRDGPSGDLE